MPPFLCPDPATNGAVVRERPPAPDHCNNIMIQYRFITPHRTGKWYGSLADAQTFANSIGAGFLDPAGTFVPYRGTVLELRDDTTAVA